MSFALKIGFGSSRDVAPVAGQGVAILLNRRFADSASIRFAERRVGRVLMVLVPALRGHPLRRRPTTLISVYQHARSSEQAEVYANRAKNLDPLASGGGCCATSPSTYCGRRYEHTCKT